MNLKRLSLIAVICLGMQPLLAKEKAPVATIVIHDPTAELHITTNGVVEITSDDQAYKRRVAQITSAVKAIGWAAVCAYMHEQNKAHTIGLSGNICMYTSGFFAALNTIDVVASMLAPSPAPVNKQEFEQRKN